MEFYGSWHESDRVRIANEILGFDIFFNGLGGREATLIDGKFEIKGLERVLAYLRQKKLKKDSPIKSKDSFLSYVIQVGDAVRILNNEGVYYPGQGVLLFPHEVIELKEESKVEIMNEKLCNARLEERYIVKDGILYHVIEIF